MSTLTDTLGRLDGGLILDVACGTGEFTRMLARCTRGPRSVVGIDPDKDSIDEARRLTDDRRIRFRLTALEQSGYRDDRFDTVAISNALHHLHDPARSLEEMRRMLRPGGYLVLREPVSDHLTPAQANGRDIHHLKARIDSLRGRIHRSTYARAEVKRLVVSLGVEVVDSCVDRDGEDIDFAAVSEITGFLDEYLAHAPESAREELSESLDDLKRRIAANGAANPPRVVFVGRLPIASSVL
jgi:SAM-dependent methyltransferase